MGVEMARKMTLREAAHIGDEVISYVQVVPSAFQTSELED